MGEESREGEGEGRNLLSTTEIFSDNYTFEQHSQYYLLVLILFKTSNNQHDWTPVEYLHFLHHNRAQKQLLH